ncbi:MAG: hypothetical protein M3Y56_09265, partial [Armatimonadota bacterium]|nr:hypothetical protein [Armatimonadota bacterium]
MFHRQKTFDIQDEFREVSEGQKGIDHRPFLTWDWNDRLDTAEVRRQVRCFAEANFRGFIITPAAGLLSHPLDTEWMDALEAAVDEAQRQNLKICLQERMHLPAPTLSNSNQQQAHGLYGSILKAEVLAAGPDSNPPPPAHNTIAFYSARQVNGKLVHIHRLGGELAAGADTPGAQSPLDSTGPLPPLSVPDDSHPGEEPLASPEPHEEGTLTSDAEHDTPAESPEIPDPTLAAPSLPDSPAMPQKESGNSVPDEPGDKVLLHLYAESTGLLDPLSMESVRSFMDGAPENYFREFGAEFGKTITGLVVDVPGFSSPPWSGALPASFEEMFGKDLLNILPCVLLDAEGTSEDRLQYWNAVSSLFARACTGQIEAWCSNREIRFWARFEGSGSLAGQMARNGGVMPQYNAASGFLLPYSEGRADMALAFKQAASSVHQGEDKRLMAELSHVSDHSEPFAPTLAAAVSAVAFGANDLCTSRVPFSLRGSRKVQPHSFSHPQQPSWPLQRRINQFLTRLHFLLDMGESATSLAILHPLRSAWKVYPESLQALDELLQSVTDDANSNSCDFDFLDETLLQSKATIQQAKLRMGCSLYR